MPRAWRWSSRRSASRLCVFLARTVFPNSQGSGIPQVIAARQIEDAKLRNALVSLRTAFGKVVVMMIGLLCGASIGREGPTVQVGASIMGFIGRKSPVVYQQNLLLAGAAAGIAAAFNTPLAGIVFGIEELSRSFEAKASGLVIGCIIAAGVTSLAILGDYTYFGSTAATMPLGRVWLVVPVMAVAGGLLGGLFSRILILCLAGEAAQRHPPLRGEAARSSSPSSAGSAWRCAACSATIPPTARATPRPRTSSTASPT